MFDFIRWLFCYGGSVTFLCLLLFYEWRAISGFEKSQKKSAKRQQPRLTTLHTLIPRGVVIQAAFHNPQPFRCLGLQLPSSADFRVIVVVIETVILHIWRMPDLMRAKGSLLRGCWTATPICLTKHTANGEG